MIIKYKNFLEAISGTELVGHMGPNYPDQKIPNTLNISHTSILFSETTCQFYTHDDYQSLYIKYLKSGGSPLSGFNLENLETVISKSIN